MKKKESCCLKLGSDRAICGGEIDTNTLPENEVNIQTRLTVDSIN
jgi:hypothetical protein